MEPCLRFDSPSLPKKRTVKQFENKRNPFFSASRQRQTKTSPTLVGVAEASVDRHLPQGKQRQINSISINFLPFQLDQTNRPNFQHCQLALSVQITVTYQNAVHFGSIGLPDCVGVCRSLGRRSS
uniref:Uncharacterized protein n=1 Tax=Panagrellus redivivus TaxID=6233 RepID=A0A7E4VIM4_PANRE